MKISVNTDNISNILQDAYNTGFEEGYKAGFEKGIEAVKAKYEADKEQITFFIKEDMR